MYAYIEPLITSFLGFEAPALVQFLIGMLPLVLLNFTASVLGRSKTTAYRVFLVVYTITLALVVCASNGVFLPFGGVA